MENVCKSSLENYGVNINDLWHISYAIKIWLNIVLEGFIIGLMLSGRLCNIDMRLTIALWVLISWVVEDRVAL